MSDLLHILIEMYHQTLAKALAHFFEAKLLLLDVTDFNLKVSWEAMQFFLHMKHIIFLYLSY